MSALARVEFRSIIGTRHECQCCARMLTVTGVYEGHGPDDPNGYYYEFDNEPQRRWISTSAAAVRFRQVGGIEHTKQAIENLKMAIDVLIEHRATEADIKPYRTNLAEQEARLSEQELKRRRIV